jgi:transcriptional regulator with XRE-family HTH domain
MKDGFVGQKIKALRQARGWSQYRLAKVAGIPRPMITAWELGKQNPSAKYLAKLAAAFGVPVEALLYGDNVQITDGKPILRLPIVLRVSAGSGNGGPVILEEAGTIEVTIEEAMAADAAIEVSGESMLPTLEPGDICGIRWQDYPPAHGKLVVACIDDIDKPIIKRYIDKGTYFVLRSDNRKFGDYSSREHQIRIIGKVVWMKRWYERR